MLLPVNQIGRIKYGSSGTTYESNLIDQVRLSRVNDTFCGQLDSGTIVIHTTNIIVAELNTSIEVVMNFDILNSVFKQISECRSILK